MTKEVLLKLRIDTDAVLHAVPEGTQGEECLELMKFLESIPGFHCRKTVATEDALDKDVVMTATGTASTSS